MQDQLAVICCVLWREFLAKYSNIQKSRFIFIGLVTFFDGAN